MISFGVLASEFNAESKNTLHIQYKGIQYKGLFEAVLGILPDLRVLSTGDSSAKGTFQSLFLP